MSNTSENRIKEIVVKANKVLARHPVKKAGLFGSVTRGEDNEESDIDMLIELDESVEYSLLDFVGIKFELEEELGKTVDLTHYKTIKPALAEYILPYEIKVYEKN